MCVCVEVGVFLIFLFVGCIMDWYKVKEGCDFVVSEDLGVLLVIKIYNYYKEYGYKMVVMGVSFCNIGEILELVGCDCLIIVFLLLVEFEVVEGELVVKLVDLKGFKVCFVLMMYSEFLWEYNLDVMVVEKLVEGICNFVVD